MITTLPLGAICSHLGRPAIQEFSRVYGRAPDDTGTLAEWSAVVPSTTLLYVLQDVDGGEKILRAVAMQYAQRALPVFEAARPGDTRPRSALAVIAKSEDGSTAATRAGYEAEQASVIASVTADAIRSYLHAAATTAALSEFEARLLRMAVAPNAANAANAAKDAMRTASRQYGAARDVGLAAFEAELRRLVAARAGACVCAAEAAQAIAHAAYAMGINVYCAGDGAREVAMRALCHHVCAAHACALRAGVPLDLRASLRTP